MTIRVSFNDHTDMCNTIAQNSCSFLLVKPLFTFDSTISLFYKSAEYSNHKARGYNRHTENFDRDRGDRTTMQIKRGKFLVGVTYSPRTGAVFRTAIPAPAGQPCQIIPFSRLTALYLQNTITDFPGGAVQAFSLS